MPVPSYNVTPGTQGGSGTYGSVPGIIGLPPNLYSQTAGQFPLVNPAGTNATGFINAETAGQVAPDVFNTIARRSAASGVASGSPGSDFAMNNMNESLALDSQNLAHQGVQDYLSFITGQGNQMTNPDLAFTVAQQNAVNAAAPNPVAAANALMGLAQPHGGGGTMFAQSSPPSIGKPAPSSGGFSDGGANPPIMYGPGGGPGVGPGYTPTDPNKLVSDWWNQYGGTNMNWNNSADLSSGVPVAAAGGAATPSYGGWMDAGAGGPPATNTGSSYSGGQDNTSINNTLSAYFGY